MPAWCLLLLAAGLLASAPARGEPWAEFSSRGLPRSQGVVVRVSHPPQWRKVPVEDDMALAELRGPQGRLTGILQLGRGRPRSDIEALCRPERARTLLQGLAGSEEGARVTEVIARRHEGRPAYEIGYQRRDGATALRVRSLLVCLKDSQLLVSCAGAAEARAALGEIDPVCARVLGSVTISED